MTYATKDQFFNSMDRRYNDVDCREYGTYRIQSITELERSSCELAMLGKDGDLTYESRLSIKARYIIAAVVDGQGRRLFNDADIDKIQACDSKLTNKLVDAITLHCGISEKDIDESEKNSEATGDDNSPTNSQLE